jgi:hypothetical protein
MQSSTTGYQPTLSWDKWVDLPETETQFLEQDSNSQSLEYGVRVPWHRPDSNTKCQRSMIFMTCRDLQFYGCALSILLPFQEFI